MTAKHAALILAIAAILGLAACGSGSGSQQATAGVEEGPCITPNQGGGDLICGEEAKTVCAQELASDPRCAAAGLQTGTVTTEEPATESSDDPAASGSRGSDFASPDFVIVGRIDSGDKVQILGRVGEATTLEESDADPEALATCSGASNRRAMVVRLDLRTTVTSGLPAQVRLTKFSWDSGYASYSMSYLMGYSDGPQCGDGGLEQIVDLGELQPDQPADFVLWATLDDAITPDDPDPSTKTLGQHALIKPPIVFLGGGELAYGTADSYKLGGPRVIDCAAGRTISIAGIVPKRLASSGTGESLPCRSTATPKFAG
jgi:hypothetical protein